MVATGGDSPLTNENTNRSDSRKQWDSVAPQPLAAPSPPRSKRSPPNHDAGNSQAVAVPSPRLVSCPLSRGRPVKEREQVAFLVQTVEQVAMRNVIDGVRVTAHQEIPHRILTGHF
jgi:hypothetical protein